MLKLHITSSEPPYGYQTYGREDKRARVHITSEMRVTAQAICLYAAAEHRAGRRVPEFINACSAYKVNIQSDTAELARQALWQYAEYMYPSSDGDVRWEAAADALGRGFTPAADVRTVWL